ncbi:nuclear pore complex protein Nup214-like isoform X2 [Montipora foliosa]
MALFDVPTLGSNDISNAKFGEINLSVDTGETMILNVAWNPGFPSLFATCLSSGSVLMMELTEREVKILMSLPADHKASAICWSPKGKQLVVGHADGRLTQYSQQLEVKKEIECPELFTDDPHKVTDVLWISTSLFAAVYSSFEDGDCPKFLLISTPKNEPVAITNFDDIYFAMSDDREDVFYLRNISEWSIVVSAFSNGLEAAVIGKYGGEAEGTWEKWSFEEDGRPSMPLTSNNDESFPMGLAFDFSSRRPFLKGEQRLPPAPVMMILSTDGVLCPFYVINQTPNANHDIVRPPEPLPLRGQRKPVVSHFSSSSSQITDVQPQLPAAQSGQPAAMPQLVKPTPTSQTQLNFASRLLESQFIATKVNTQPKGLSLGDGWSNVSASPTPKSGQGVVTHPNPVASTQSPVPRPLTENVRSEISSAAGFQASNTATEREQGRFRLGGEQPKVPARSVSSSPKSGQDLVAQPFASQPLPVTRSFADSLKAERSTATTFESLAQTSRFATKTRQEASRKEAVVSVSKSNVIEASVSQNIQEVIRHFEQEMAVLGENVSKMQMNCHLPDDDNDLHFLKTTTDRIGRSIAAIRDETKVQHKDIDEEKRKLLERFEICEDARIRQERKSDPRYIQLLKSRALDPVNTNKMRDIRKLHLYLDETLREVNMVLDEQWNKENERKRSIPSPALEEIYKTLRVNQKIALDQEAKLQKIAEDIKNRILLSNSWQRNPTNTDTSRQSLIRSPSATFEEECKSRVQRTSPVSVPISPERSAQLRSMLQKRRSTPVRRSIIVPSTRAKTPSLKPSKSQEPLTSSTPAISTRAPPEVTKDRFVVKSQLTEQEEVSLDHGHDDVVDDTDIDGNDRELEQLTDATDTVSSSSSAASGFSLGVGKAFVSSAGASKDEVAKDKEDFNDTVAVAVKPEAAESSPAKPTRQITASGAFTAVGKSAELQTVPNTEKTEVSNQPSGFFLPAAKEQLSLSSAAPTKSEFTPAIKVISSGIPPNVAAGMAALNRASAAQNGLQLPSNNNLDPSAGIEPVTLVAYKPQTQKPSQNAVSDAENAAAKAIANAALMAATAEAKKPSTKPQCSTEFVFKSTEGGKPGPPVVTFKPQTSPQQSESRSTVAPNVTVNPMPIFKPSFAPAVPTSSTTFTTGGLRLSLSGASPAAPPLGQLPSSPVSASFVPQAGGRLNLGSSSGTSFSAPNLLSFSSKCGDLNVTTSSQMPVVSSSAGSIAPSQTVSRNLFVSGDVNASGTATDKLQDESRESGLSSSISQPNITDSSGFTAPVTTAPFSFSLPPSSSGSLFKNLGSSSNTVLAVDSGVTRNLFGSPTAKKQEESRESGVPSKSSITNSSGINAPVTSVSSSFSVPTTTSGSFFKNLGPSSNTGIALGSGVKTDEIGSGIGILPKEPTDKQQEKSKESSVPSSISNLSITYSSGLPAPVTTAPFSFCVSSTSSGSLFGNPATSSDVGRSPGLGDAAVSSTSMISALLRSSEASGTAISTTNTVPTSAPSLSLGTFSGSPDSSTSIISSLLRLSEASGTAISTTNTVPTSAPSSSLGTLSGSPDTSAVNVVTSPSVGGLSGVGGVFAQALSESSKPLKVLPSETAVPTLPQASSMFGSVTTTVPSTSGALFGLSSTSFKASVTTPPANSAANSFITLSAGSPPSAFSATSTAGAFFPSIMHTTTNVSAPIGSPPVTILSSPQSTTTILTSADGTSASVTSGLFANASSPTSAFGLVSSAESVIGFGSLGITSNTSSSGSVFGTSSSTAFAPKSVFGTFTPPVSTQASSFGSAPLFGSAVTSPGTSLTFGAKPSPGQTSFVPATSSGFNQSASKPAENALSFGFSGFGLGGPGTGTSQANKENPFIVAQGFAVPATTQSSLFSGKSGEDVFKSSFSGGPFSRPGFGSSSSGGFSGGNTFSSQGGGVLSSGFGFGAASGPAPGSSAFGSSQPFASPASSSVFGGAPSFGSSSSFGGTPLFGASPQGGLSTAQSTGVFGTGSSGLFGQSSGSPSFGALASQTNIPSFGSLSGQSPTQAVGFGSIMPQPQPQPQPQQQTPSFGSFGGGSQSPSGTSFSQWR